MLSLFWLGGGVLLDFFLFMVVLPGRAFPSRGASAKEKI